MNVKIIKPNSPNSTQIDNFLQKNVHGQARGGGVVVEVLNLSWITALIIRLIKSYAIVSAINLLLYPFLKKFGFGGPHWETSINLGNHEEHSVFNFGPNLKKLRLSFGNSQGTKSKDSEMKEGSGEQGGGQGHGGHGWGQGNMYPPGHVGYNPSMGPGWLSYEQAAFALVILGILCRLGMDL